MKTHVWQRTFALWLGLAVFVYELWQMILGDLSPFWIILTFLVYYLIALSITVGYHRLFTHNSFKCGKFWHYLFGIVGCISINSSPVQWSIVHYNHHKYSDTDKDPHVVSWKYFFRVFDGHGLEVSKGQVRLMRDPFHNFLVNYSFGLFLLAGIVFYLVDINLFLYGLLSPICLYLFNGGIHTIYVHRNGQPRNYWPLEFLFPTAGEWNHRVHHEVPINPYFNGKGTAFDLGGWLIGVIRNDCRISDRKA